ncbi:hypothetical protein OSTOST_10067 [Ostertagia ostertagi]
MLVTCQQCILLPGLRPLLLFEMYHLPGAVKVKTLIRNRDLPLRCYHMDCGQLFSITDLKCLLLGDNRLPWLNAKKLHALVDSSIDYVLRRDRSLSRCPTPDCFGIFKVSSI